jgi:hypothetical protein
MTGPLTIVECRRAMTRHGLLASQFGKMAAGDYSLIRRMRAGAEIGPAVTERVRAFIARLDATAKPEGGGR